jgi:Ser/Thr protein kinase RdoA (MazF antagonist)
MAERALSYYDITHYSSNLIRHNENAAFDVCDADTGERYLLRIHRPVSASVLGIQHMYEALCSEVYILQEFRAGTGLPLQQPVLSRDGRYVMSVDHPEDHVSSLCTLLTWVEGEMLDQGREDAGNLVREMGRVAARMNAFARRWEPDRPLIRPVYDTGKYRSLIDRIALGLELGLFGEEHFELVLAAMRRVEDVFGKARRNRQSWGIIHADIKPDNVVVAGGGPGIAGDKPWQLVPIDFCFAGYGFYMFDVGGVVPGLKPHLRGEYVAGYREVHGELSEDDERLASACFLLSIFGGVGFSMKRPGAHEWIKRRMPVWAGEYCRRYLEGESLLTTGF